VGTKAGVDAVVRRKISQPLPRLELPIFQPVAQRYTTELPRFHMVIGIFI
jgi:hypothetical protein